MREGENLKALSQLPIDYIGFIFYNQSKRFVEQKMEGLDLVEKKKVGVFVNELLNVVMEKVGDYELDVVQLHGTEGPEYCRQLKTFLGLGQKPVQLVKAFSVDEGFDFLETKEYELHSDCLLYTSPSPRDRTRSRMPSSA